jgi:hypothetical protein
MRHGSRWLLLLALAACTSNTGAPASLTSPGGGPQGAGSSGYTLLISLPSDWFMYSGPGAVNGWNVSARVDDTSWAQPPESDDTILGFTGFETLGPGATWCVNIPAGTGTVTVEYYGELGGRGFTGSFSPSVAVPSWVSAGSFDNLGNLVVTPGVAC